MYWLINRLNHACAVDQLRGLARLLVPALVLLLSACTPPARDVRGLFAIDSLLQAQASYLAAANATVNKQITLGSKQEEVDLKPSDSTAWFKELEAFSVMNAINKPINRDRYTVDELPDPQSNLRMRSFKGTSDDLPVSYVRVYYHGVPQRVRKIESLYTEVNGLYKTSRSLSLEFDYINGTPVMTSYSIVGGQKMFLDDSVQYDIKGRVKIGKMITNGKAGN
jgi:hypothetical protein